MNVPKRTLLIAVLAVGTVVLAGSTAVAHRSDNTRPGWGHGDRKHVHTGPPGHSVRPDHGNHGHNRNFFFSVAASNIWVKRVGDWLTIHIGDREYRFNL